jgi:hypothetical protein
MLVKVSNENMKGGEDTVKIALSDAWMRKKTLREGKGGNLETMMQGMEVQN